MKNLFLIAIAILGFSTVSVAQVEGTASASATLLTPLSIAAPQNINFGTIASSNVAGTVVLNTEDVATAYNGATMMTGETPKSAVFTISGEVNKAVTITLPAASIELTGTNTGDKLVVDTWTNNSPASTTGASGTLIIKVGATLNIPANTKADVYTNASAYKVTVDYN